MEGRRQFGNRDAMFNGKGYFHQQLRSFRGKYACADQQVGCRIAEQFDEAAGVARRDRARNVLEIKARDLVLDTCRLGLGLVHSNACDLGIGENDPW